MWDWGWGSGVGIPWDQGQEFPGIGVGNSLGLGPGLLQGIRAGNPPVRVTPPAVSQLPLGRSGVPAVLAVRGLGAGRGGGGGGAGGAAAARPGPPGAGEGPQADRVHLEPPGGSEPGIPRAQGGERRSSPSVSAQSWNPAGICPGERPGTPWSNKSWSVLLDRRCVCILGGIPVLGSALGSSQVSPGSHPRRGMWNKSRSVLLERRCVCVLGGIHTLPVLGSALGPPRVTPGGRCGINPSHRSWGDPVFVSWGDPRFLQRWVHAEGPQEPPGSRMWNKS